MGNALPIPDDRLQQVIDLLGLTEKEQRRMYRIFQAMDRESGTIDVTEFYKLINEKQNVFGDHLFHLVDIDSTGALDFSEFVTVFATYCTFGKEDVLKFCFYVFDKDKNGFIEKEELMELVNLLHDFALFSNARNALAMFDTDRDGKISFDEFCALNVRFPQVLFPAFRMQHSMMQATMGESWWVRRKERLLKKRDEEEEAALNAERRAFDRELEMRNRDIKRRMGVFAYHCCPGVRAKYEHQARKALEAELAELEAKDEIAEEEEDPNERWKRKRRKGFGTMKDFKDAEKRGFVDGVPMSPRSRRRERERKRQEAKEREERAAREQPRTTKEEREERKQARRNKTAVTHPE